MNSDTPRTNAAVIDAAQYYQPLYPSTRGKHEPVHADFARNMERELDRIARMVKALHDSPKSLLAQMTQWADNRRANGGSEPRDPNLSNT